MIRRGRPPGGGETTPPMLKPLNGLRAARLAAHYSQEAAGALIGCNKARYGKFELGTSRLDLLRAEVLANAFGVRMDMFLQD